MSSLDGLCSELRDRLREAVRSNLADAMLFSGGLDTSIIASLASSMVRLYCLTIAFRDGPNPDLPYAKLLASKLNLEHRVVSFGLEELEDALRKVVLCLRTFDPMEVRNSVAIQLGLEALIDSGFKEAMTGDGGDELFAGYSFLFNKKPSQLKDELERMWRVMRFSSIELGDSLGMRIKTPYLDPRVREIAERIEPELKVRRRGDEVYGKWILRKAFEGLLPEEIIWRRKLPIEVGVGTTVLPRLFGTRLGKELEEGRRLYLERDGVKIRDAEHMYYYKVYRELLGPPSRAKVGERACSACGSPLIGYSQFCRVCGEYPA